MLFNFFINYKKEFISISISIFGLILGFSIDIIIARLLYLNEFGIYKYLYTFVILFSLFLSFGSSQLLIKKFAEKKSFNKKIEDLINQSALSFILIIIFLFFFLILNSYFLPEDVKKNIYLFNYIFIWIFFRIIFINFRAANIGTGNYLQAQISDRFLINVLLILFISIYYFFFNDLALYNLIIINLIVFILVIFYLYLYIFKINISNLNIKFYLSGIKERFINSKYTSLSEFLDLCNRMGILLIMGFSYSLKEIAIFSVLIRITDALFLINTSLISLYGKNISSNEKKIQDYGIKKLNQFNLLSIVVIMIFFFFFSYTVLNLFGPEFSLYSSSLFIMALIIFKLLFGPSSFFLNIHGESKINFRVNLATFVLMILSFSLFSQILEIKYIVYLYVIINISNNAILSFFCKKKLNTRTDVFALRND
jgi:O-antigen/teichoic acid export membrane protein